MSNKLMKKVFDKDLIDYYYLDHTIDQLIDRLHRLTFKADINGHSVPFNAQVRGYQGAIDSENCYWIIKKMNDESPYTNRLYELAYYIDFSLQTLAAPSMLIKIDDTYYRGSKVVLKGIQISGYNYTESPFKNVLANDLINRWLFFDEDRNPNNYMVIHNSKQLPLIVAIDYNKIDLETTVMKITGNDNEFGWYREEKTRFLTLLKPSNFDDLDIKCFQSRLDLLMTLSKDKLMNICRKLFKGLTKNPENKAELVVSNLVKRRNYINTYFRKHFKVNNPLNQSDYSGLGKTFTKMYKDK